jgi:hypothetical protein
MSIHDYNVKVDSKNYHVEVATKTLYGWFEHHNGGEGGLWFDLEDAKLVLIDYDGVFSLPAEVKQALQSVGIGVGDDF